MRCTTLFALMASMPAVVLARGSCDLRGGPDCSRLGESCADVDCRDPLLCDSSSQVCIKGVPLGGKCDTKEQCEGFAFCGATTKVCTKWKTQGKSCANNEECFKSQCKDGICKRLSRENGSYCDTSADCNAGLVCNRFVGTATPDPSQIKTCAPDDGTKVGQDCSNDGDCASSSSGGRAAKCQNRVCAPDLSCVGPGIFCTRDVQCCSNNCEFRFDPMSFIPITQCA